LKQDNLFFAHIDREWRCITDFSFFLVHIPHLLTSITILMFRSRNRCTVWTVRGTGIALSSCSADSSKHGKRTLYSCTYLQRHVADSH
jgi:hypothetical protein